MPTLQEWEKIYHTVAQVIIDEPQIPSVIRRDTPEVLRWLGQVGAVIEQVNGMIDHSKFKNYRQSLLVTTHVDPSAQMRHIRSLLYAALGKAALKAPTSAIGTFIPAGNPLDAIAAVTNILRACRGPVLVVDPDLNTGALTDFFSTIAEGTQLRLLASDMKRGTDLPEAVNRWKSLHSVELRYAPSLLLHDRLVIDDENVWSLSQSFNALAQRAPAMIQRVGRDIASAKRDAFTYLWISASPA